MPVKSDRNDARGDHTCLFTSRGSAAKWREHVSCSQACQPLYRCRGACHSRTSAAFWPPSSIVSRNLFATRVRELVTSDAFTSDDHRLTYCQTRSANERIAPAASPRDFRAQRPSVSAVYDNAWHWPTLCAYLAPHRRWSRKVCAAATEPHTCGRSQAPSSSLCLLNHDVFCRNRDSQR